MADRRNNPRRFEAEAEVLRGIERGRLRALVAGDVDRASDLHADDFQLVDPGGGVHSRREYLAMVASGELNYVVWEPDSIGVRLYDDAAVIRYRSEIEATVNGEPVPRSLYWHTDLYERHGDHWQVVWSQATQIR